MSKLYKFEVQDLIEVSVEADSREDARREVVDRLHNDEFVFDGNAYVSDGEEVKK